MSRNNKILCRFLAAALFVAAAPLRADKESIATAGDILQILLPAGGASYALWTGDVEGLNQYAYSFGTSWSSTYLLKYTVRRVRPSFSNDQSYPSGHTMGAFSGASFIERRYGDKMGEVFRYSPYVVAGFVGWSRVYAEAHHVGDVLTGAMLGVVPTYSFTTPFGTQGQIAPFSSGGTTGVSISAPLPADGNARALNFRNIVKWPGFGYGVNDQRIFEDPYDVSRSNLTRTRATFRSEVLSLDPKNVQSGWIAVAAAYEWNFARGHSARVSIPYVEVDFPAFTRTVGGIGDVRLTYRWAFYEAAHATDLFQGATFELGTSLPTGSEEDSIGSDAFIWTPRLRGAFSFADGRVGFFPMAAYIRSSGNTTARSVTTSGLFRPGVFGVEAPRELRAFVLDLPVSWRFSDRWTIGAGATMNHDKRYGDGVSWMGNIAVGFKVSETATFAVDYGEHLSGPDPILGRFRMQVAVNW